MTYLPNFLTNATRLLSLRINSNMIQQAITLIRPERITTTITSLMSTARNIANGNMRRRTTMRVIISFTFAIADTTMITNTMMRQVNTIFTIVKTVRMARIKLRRTQTSNPIIGRARRILLVRVFRITMMMLNDRILNSFMIAANMSRLITINNAQKHAIGKRILIITKIAPLRDFSLATGRNRILSFTKDSLATLPNLQRRAAIINRGRQILQLRDTRLRFNLKSLSFHNRTRTKRIVGHLTIKLT